MRWEIVCVYAGSAMKWAELDPPLTIMKCRNKSKIFRSYCKLNPRGSLRSKHFNFQSVKIQPCENWGERKNSGEGDDVMSFPQFSCVKQVKYFIAFQIARI